LAALGKVERGFLIDSPSARGSPLRPPVHGRGGQLGDHTGERVGQVVVIARTVIDPVAPRRRSPAFEASELAQQFGRRRRDGESGYLVRRELPPAG
jgi:hypothetical protein